MERITGVLSRANGTGFQLAGREGWVNVSKFAVDVVIPPAGTAIAAELDAKGFVRRLEPIGKNDRVPRQNGDPASAFSDQPAADRQRQIARMHAITAAATILGAGPGHPVDPAEVVALARRLSAEVLRA